MVRLAREGVELETRESPFLRDHLGPETLVERHVLITRAHRGSIWLTDCSGRPERHSAHRLNPAGEHEIVVSRHDTHGGELDRLLARSARTVDGDAGNGLWPTGSKRGKSSHVARLVTELGCATPHDVVNLARIDTRAIEQRVENLSRKVDGMDLRQGTTLSPYR